MMCLRRRHRPRRGRELAGAQIELDEFHLVIGCGEQMYMDLVGAEVGPALADLGEVQGPARVKQTANAQHLSAAAFVAASQNERSARQFRALEQIVDGVNVAPFGGAAPEVEALDQPRLWLPALGFASRASA